MAHQLDDISLPSFQDELVIQPRDDISVPVTPLFCFNGLAGKKDRLPSDASDKAKLLSCLVELTKRASELGLDTALRNWDRDYKIRPDWQDKHGGSRDYYSLRVANNSPFRICNSITNGLESMEARAVFHLWEVVNEKN